jgi:HAD superfamily hydrolase (TIGR01509 family)
MAEPGFPDTLPAGAVFDVDGTLLDNMPFHVEAFNAFTVNHGLPALTPERRHWMDGKRNSDIFPGLFERALTPAEVAAMSDEKESMYRRLSAGRLAPLPGLMRLLDALDALGIPVALATSAPPENVAHTLRELGLAARLEVIARSDEVAHGKPHPDVFLEAARRLDVAAARCLAFEDAPAGIVAARRAGMTCVGVATSYGPDVLGATNPPPDFIVRDYDDFLGGPGAALVAACARLTQK